MTATSYVNPRKILKQAMKGVRAAATTTTTVFGNVAVGSPSSFAKAWLTSRTVRDRWKLGLATKLSSSDGEDGS